MSGLTAFALSGPAVPRAHAQAAAAVWTNADDRDYSGNPPVFQAAYWSYGYVAPDANGSGGHAGNWSGNLVPGKGGPLDVYLGAPGDTLCDVQVTLNSLTLAPGGALAMDFSSSLTVTTTNLATDGTIAFGGGTGGGEPVYTNTGTLTKSAGSGTSAFDPAITFNSEPGSTVAANSGTLQLPGVGGLFDTVAFVPAAGATINLVAQDTASTAYDAHFQGTLSNGAGTGTVLLSGGMMSGGSAPCTLAFTGSVFQWTGGQIGIPQRGDIFNNTGVVNLSGDGDKDNVSTFTNTGTMIQTGAGNFSVGNYHDGGSVTNATGATYDLQSDTGLTTDAFNAFNNAGTFQKSAGTGTSTVSALVTNTGTVSVYTGTLLFSDQNNHGVTDVTGGNTLTEGTWNVFNGATLTFAAYSALTVNQAHVTLTGPNANFTSFNALADNQGIFSLLGLQQFTTAGDLSNEGTITLDAGSTLHVAGNFTASDAASGTGAAGNGGGKHIQAATSSTIQFIVGGTATSGAQSPGVLQIAGIAKMAGLMEIALADLAATPGPADTLTVLTAKSVSGSFDNAPSGTRLPTTDGRGSFLVTYGAGAIGLSQFLATGQSVFTPTVTIAVAGDGDAVEGGAAGKVVIRRTGGDLTNALVVRYKVAGGVVAGVDYKPLPGTAMIPAGATQVKVKIKPIDDTIHEGTRVAKIKLKPALDGSYLLGATTTAKVHIIDND